MSLINDFEVRRAILSPRGLLVTYSGNSAADPDCLGDDSVNTQMGSLRGREQTSGEKVEVRSFCTVRNQGAKRKRRAAVK